MWNGPQYLAPAATWVLAQLVGMPAAHAAQIPGTDDIAFEVLEKTSVWQVLERMASEQGIQADVDEVVEHLRDMTRVQQPVGRLTRVLNMLANPWSAPAHSRELRDLLLRPVDARDGPDFALLFSGIAGWLDLEGMDPRAAGGLPDELPETLHELWEEIRDPLVTDTELLERLSEFLAAAHDHLREPLLALDESSRALLFAGHEGASEAWYRSHFPDVTAEAASTHSKTLLEYREVLRKVDRRRALLVGAALSRLAEPPFLARLGKRLSRLQGTRHSLEGMEGALIAVVGDLPETTVVVGGRGTNVYAAPAALVVDLGGHDTYRRAAVANDPSLLVSVVIDVSGNDRYETDAVGPAYAVAGASLLVDLRGKDLYRGGRHAQASSAGGFALLLDMDGDDRYEAADYSQGYSLCGLALLYDLDGDDSYQAWSYAQGAGNGPGFSALVDVAGDDQYLADLKWPDVYGDSGPDVYHGASQGFSLGFRDGAPRLAGGIAALLDASGRDRYQAGNFSQGGGYYFGFGLMYDGGGDDESLGTRYSQGFGVHQAVGVSWDESGDDLHRTRTVANCGSAWDEGVGWLIDSAGDDRYEAGGLSLGGAAQTAVAVLLDLEGVDHYVSGGGKDTQGGAGSSEYHDKQSLGFLLDLGGDRDTYSRTDRADDRAALERWHGFFLDVRAASAEEILSSRRPLMGKE